MLLMLNIAGAVALLLFGVRYLRKGLDRLVGNRLPAWMSRIGARPGLAFIWGVCAGALAPSSTTMSLLAVQTVQAGHMNARQMLAVMLGANVGLTVLVQLIALRLDAYAPLFILAGFVLFQYTTAARTRGIGQVLLALGFFFLAMFVIRSGVRDANLAGNADLRELLEIAQRYPLLLAFIAAVMATLLQSATATIGVVIGLGNEGILDIGFALPIVIGANVGLAITTLIVSWRQVESRRLGVANLMLKIIVAAIGFAAAGFIVDLFEQMPGTMATRVALMHTSFNLVQALIGMPAIRILNRALERLIPAPLRPESGGRFGPKYISRGPIDSVALATGQSMREIMHMSEIVRSMMRDVWIALKHNDERLAHDVSERDNKVDLLDSEVKRFLTRLAKEDFGGDGGPGDEQIRQLQYLTELETVGDIIDKNICDLVRKKIRLRAKFSPEGERELDEFHAKVTQNLLIAETAFATREARLAKQLLRHKRFMNLLEQEMRDRHFARLNAGLALSHESSAIHLDLLTHMKRINSAVTHVAYPILESGHRRGDRDDASLESAI